MAAWEKIQKSRVRENEQALIVCPECGYSKELSIAQFRDHQRVLKIKCRCSHTFKLALEFRVHPRKDTDLEGMYTIAKDKGGSNWRARVLNLSLGGACLEITGRHPIQVGDRGTLQFTLDDRKQSVVLKKVQVRSISGNRIGCQFIADRAYQKELGFYLRA